MAPESPHRGKNKILPLGKPKLEMALYGAIMGDLEA